MAIDAGKFALENLSAFKERMRIDHKLEDDLLKRMLQTSVKVVAALVGANDVSDELTELSFERARYVYHDALDEFFKNYADEIEILYLSIKLSESEVSEDDEK